MKNRTSIFKKSLYLFIAASLFLSCQKEKEEDPKTVVAGKFVISRQSNLKSARTNVPDDSANFNLDTVKSSRSFFFIVSNSGQSDITDVTITADNKNFSTTPSVISKISGPDNNESAALYQIFTLDVLHGTMINGVGNADFLNMGENICNLTIEGKTFDGDSIIAIRLTAKIKVFAQTMAVELFQGSHVYDMAKRDRTLIGCEPFDITEMCMFNYTSIEPPVTLKNTGNVSIKMSLSNFHHGSPIVQDVTINPQDTVNLNLTVESTVFSTDGGKIRLNSNGTVFDKTKLSLGNDGNAYFSMNFNEIW